MLKPRTEQEIMRDIKKKADKKWGKKIVTFGILGTIVIGGYKLICVHNEKLGDKQYEHLNLDNDSVKTSTPVENIPVVEPKLAEEPETPYEQTDEMGGQPAELPQSSSVSVIKNPSTIEGYSQEDKDNFINTYVEETYADLDDKINTTGDITSLSMISGIGAQVYSDYKEFMDFVYYDGSVSYQFSEDLPATTFYFSEGSEQAQCRSMARCYQIDATMANNYKGLRDEYIAQKKNCEGIETYKNKRNDIQENMDRITEKADIPNEEKSKILQICETSIKNGWYTGTATVEYISEKLKEAKANLNEKSR